MAELPYQAVIVDLDRTLLRTDKSISEYTAEVLKAWQDAGAFLYAATARPERAVTEYRQRIGFRSVTTLNGARTITPAGVSENPIDAAGAASVLEQLARREGTFISVEAENGIYSNREFPLWAPVVLNDLTVLPGREKIYKILASHPDIPPDRIEVRLPEGVYCTVADKKLLQVMNGAATKWNGIRRMLEQDRISAVRAIFFGDDNDDLEPIRRCGRGVAVSNALACVREIADDITLSNDEDGIARYLAKLLGL